MSLEINKKGLSGKAVKIIDNAILKADLDNSGKIDTEQEKLLFDFAISNNDVLTKSEKKQILGKKEVKEDSEAKQERQARRADRKDERGSKALFNETLDNLAKNGVTRNDVVKELKRILITESAEPNAAEKYGSLIKVVEEVIALMPKEYDNINAIDSNRAKVRAQFVENDTLHRDVLRNLSEMAKNEKRKAAYVDITDRFAKEIQTDAKAGTKRTDEVIMDKILEDLRKEGKYIDASTKGAKYKDEYQNEYVDAYNAYIKNEVMKDVRVLLTQVILGNDEDIKTHKVHKKAKDFLKENGFYDKYVRKADKQKGFGRKASKAQALENNVELNTIQTEKKILGVLKDAKQQAKLHALMSATTTLLDSRGEIILDENGEPKQFNLITKREDGYYDLSTLSNLIREAVGSDNTRNKHKEKAISELTRVIGNINKNLVETSSGLQLDKQEVLDLIDLCGFDTKGNGWSWLKAGLGMLGGALAHGATAGAATWTNEYQTYLDCPPDIPDIELDNNINISEIIKDSGLDINIDVNVSIKTIIKDIMANEEAFLVVMPKLIAQNAIKSAVLGGILGLLNGIQEHEEIPVGSIKVEDATLQDYSNRLKAEGNKYANLFTAIAVGFGYVDEKGNLDSEGLQKFLGSVLAGNDILNKQELKDQVTRAYAAAKTHRLLEKPEQTTTENKVTPEKDVKLVVTPKTEPVIVEKPVEETWTYEHSWQAMIYAYYPGIMGKESYSEIKAAVDTFRRTHGISFQSGIPVGDRIQFKPLTINGKTYYPDKNGADRMDEALVKYGWESKFFNQKWDVKPKEISRLTVKEYKDGEKIVWYGVRTNADGTETQSGRMESKEKAVEALWPDASNEAVINLTITVRNQKGEVVETKKEKIAKKEN